MRTLHSYITLLACMGVTAAMADELPVVAFTNTQIFADIEFPQVETSGNYGGSEQPDSRFGTPYSDVTPFLAPQSNYIGQPLYGGGERTMYDITNPFDGIKRSRAQANTGWRFDVRSTRTASWSAVCLLYVKKQDFQNGGDINGVDISDNSIFTATAENGFYYPQKDAKVRCVVQQGAAFYISEVYQEFLYRDTGAETFVFSNLAATTWAEYDPSSALLFDESSAYYETQTLQNVSAVGVYFRELRDAPNAADVKWKIYECSVTADIVPEPSGVLMLAAGLIGWIRYRYTR